MKKIFAVYLFLLLIMAIMPVNTLSIADPDTDPQITSVDIVEDLLETGDLGVFVDYYLDYAVTPDESVTEAYLVSFFDTDGTTNLKTVAPYSYNDSGYGRGAAWIYFTAAEVTAYSIDVADKLLYTVKLHGNPTVTSGWAGDPPSVTAAIDNWYYDIDAAVMLRLIVLQHGADLETAWSLDMIESTAIGTRLTATYGEPYYTSVIDNLREMAPHCFASTEFSAIYEDLDYTTSFGATMTNGTGTVVGSPITFVEGSNAINITVVGTFTLVLNKGTEGTITQGTSTITNSPVDLVAGTNTITATGIGTATVNVVANNTQSTIDDNTTGSAFDLSDVADDFGMPTSVFSGLVWIVISIVICFATYSASSKTGIGGLNVSSGNSKAVMIMFDVCIIGGSLLGLLPLLVASLLFIGWSFVIGYSLFFRTSSY